jgi:hypothetical protein
MARFFATGPPQIPYSPDTEYVAKGSFGCIVKPGLPNKGYKIDNKWEQFPKSVSKIFIHSPHYYTALSSTKKAHNIMGADPAHIMNSYKYQYYSNSLPEKIRTNCKLKPNKEIFVTRMPNLGVSFIDLNGNMTAIDKLHRISFITILKQIKKVLEQVKKLQEANYVHGDIRDANVMIDPENGNISIIDFDWLLPKDEFFKRFPLGFYNSPPEAMVHKYISEDRIYEPKELGKIKTQLEEINKNMINKNGKEEWLIELIDYFNNYERYFINSNVGQSLKITRDILKDMIIKNMEVYAEKIKKNRIQYNSMVKRKLFYNEIFKTYDSYSIGFSILYLMNILYPGKIEVNSSKMAESLKGKLYNELVEYDDSTLDIIAGTIVNIKNVMAKLCSFDMATRATIDTAIKVVNDEIEKLKGPIKKSEEELKEEEKALKAIPVPLPAPVHQVSPAPSTSPNKGLYLPATPNTNSNNNANNTRKRNGKRNGNNGKRNTSKNNNAPAPKYPNLPLSLSPNKNK